MIGARNKGRPERRALSPEQIRDRISEVGGTDGHGIVIPVARSGRPCRARYVRIQSRSRFHLGIDSVQVYGIFKQLWLHNVALNKPATQSSTYRRSVASRATAPRRNGDSRAITSRGHGQWWQVDLEHEFNVSHIVVCNGLSPSSHRTYNFDVQISVDGDHWDTVYRNGNMISDVAEIREKTQSILHRIQTLSHLDVDGQRASQDPAVPYDQGRSLDFLGEIARELAVVVGAIQNDKGLPTLSAEMAERADALRNRMITEWRPIWPRSLDFPSETFDQVTLRRDTGLPGHVCFVWPRGGEPTLSATDGRAITPIRIAEALEQGLVPEAMYHELRELYHCQSSLRFDDKWWWYYADLSQVADADGLVVSNPEEHRSFGHPWQVWSSDDLVSWSLMYDHGAVLDLFHRLLNIIWRFTWRTVDELGLLMTSLTLQRRNHAGWLQSRAYQIDEDPTPDQLADFHVFLEEVNAAPSLQLPVLMTKHSFSPALKHRDKAAFSWAMKTVGDEFQRSFSMESAVWFGSLLGLIREGDYIDHDDDVDMVYFSNCTSLEEVVAEQEQLMAHFDGVDGFRTYRRDWPGKNFHVIAEQGDEAYSVDMFPAWVEKGKLGIWHDRLRVFRPFSNKVVFPLQPIEHAGHSMWGPAKPQKLLKDLYGDNWRTPLRSYYHTIQIDDRSTR